MKAFYYLFLICLFGNTLFSQNVGINDDGSNPHNSAILDIKSSNKGFLIPRMTEVERNNISMPAQGLMVFDTVLNNLYFYRGDSWYVAGEESPFQRVGGRVALRPDTDVDFVVGHTTLPYNSVSFTDDLFFFDDSKAAFRAGRLDASQRWNSPQIGEYSAAFGMNTLSSGEGSFAAGTNTEATGQESTAFGKNSVAEGNYSVAFGLGNLAEGHYTASFGANSHAKGNFSVTMGNDLVTPSYAELALGSYNTNYSSASSSAFNVADRAFVIGIGNSNFDKDVCSIWKNGFLSLGHGSPVAKLDIFGEVGENLIKVKSNNKDRMRLQSDGKFVIGGGSYVARLQANAVFQEHAMQLKVNGFQRFFVDSLGHVAIGPDAPVAKLNIQAYGSEIPLDVSVGGSRKFLIDNDGQIAIGANIPSAKLEIQAAGAEKALDVSISGARKFLIDSDGQIAIGAQLPAARLQVDANSGEDAFRVKIAGNTRLMVYGSGTIANYAGSPTFALQLQNSTTDLIGRAKAYSWNTYSDQRIKSDIQTIPYGLKDLMKLQPKSYNHHSSNELEGRFVVEEESRPDIGLIAQEVYEIIPESVSKPVDENADLWTMDYTRLIPVLIKSIQEQQEMILELREEIEELKKK